MHSKQNMPIPREDNNTSKNFKPYKDEKSTLKKQNIEKDHINLVGKSLDTGNCVRDGLLGYIP